MASSKDECFEEAVDAYQELREEAGMPWKVKITHQTAWVRDPKAPNPRWEPVKHVFKEWYHIYGYAKRKLGLGTTQVRYPDVTAQLPNGSHVVVDNKFTDKNGKIDPWRDKKNEHSGTTQLQDYKDINQQQGNNVGVPSLDKDKCKCDERKKKRQLKPQRVGVPDPTGVMSREFDMYFSPYPSGVPGRVPGRVPAPRLPIFRPMPIPIFP